MCADHLGPNATRLTRRRLMTAAAAGASMSIGNHFARSQTPALRFDFTKPLDGWTTISGKWVIEDVAGGSQGGRALVQRATDNDFNVIVAPAGPYDRVDVSVRFKPMSGHEDASGGIVFRFSEGRYYVIRANALEANFNFYYYDRRRHQIAGASVKAPALGQWHKLRITAVGDRIQGWLNEQALIDRHDSRFASGRIGLWTKADSITAFDELTVIVSSG
jgi:sorbitol-specific phosphotransferase system component IIA